MVFLMLPNWLFQKKIFKYLRQISAVKVLVPRSFVNLTFCRTLIKVRSTLLSQMSFVQLNIVWVDKITVWWNGRLTKWQFDESVNWWNVKLMKWQIDEMANWLNNKLMKWQFDEMASWWNGKLMKWQIDEMANWWNGKLMKWQID